MNFLSSLTCKLSQEIDFFVQRRAAGSHQQAGTQPEEKLEAQEQVTVTSQRNEEAGKGR